MISCPLVPSAPLRCSYTDVRCSKCDKGFYRISGKCEKCPDQLWLVYTGLVVLLFVVIGLAYFLNKRGVNLSLMAIGIDYAQVVSLFARARIRWPEELLKLFRFLSIFNLNIEITAPECLSPNISYPTKWYFIEGLPLFTFGAYYHGACGVCIRFLMPFEQAMRPRGPAVRCSRLSRSRLAH